MSYFFHLCPIEVVQSSDDNSEHVIIQKKKYQSWPGSTPCSCGQIRLIKSNIPTQKDSPGMVSPAPISDAHGKGHGCLLPVYMTPFYKLRGDVEIIEVYMLFRNESRYFITWYGR
jgi:hypothetical protein